MARAPIIISNGGILGELAKNSTDPEAEAKIKDNVERLITENMTELLIIIKGKKNDPCTYWRLRTEDVYNKKFEAEIAEEDSEKKGQEGISINDLIDQTDDLIK